MLLELKNIEVHAWERKDSVIKCARINSYAMKLTNIIQEIRVAGQKHS